LNASRGNEHNLEERQFNVDIQDFQINTEEIEEARRSFEYNGAESNKNVATFFLNKCKVKKILKSGFYKKKIWIIKIKLFSIVSIKINF